MKKVGAVFVILACLCIVASFRIGDEKDGYIRKTLPFLSEEVKPNLNIREGYVSQKEETVKIVRKGKTVAKIILGEPVLVAQAEKEEKWGFFQFPILGRALDGRLIMSWQMKADTHLTYGKGHRGKMMSLDEGKTWMPLDKGYVFKYRASKVLEMQDGNTMIITTPAAKDIKSYTSFPNPLYKDKSMKMDFFLESELPEDLRGAYLTIQDRQGKVISNIHSEVEDPELLRYSIGGLIPIKWFGDIKELKDGSLIAGIYPSCYKNNTNELPKSDITFYKSTDGGYHWSAIGRIPFKIEKLRDKSRQYDRYQGFSESTFEILEDSTFFCVIRTGYNTPLYRSYSYDRGRHWTKPEAFTSNGVKPQLLSLDNGVMVMASGRPGLQLRFCLDGDGKVWTEPVEMLPFMEKNGKYDMWDVSCGYINILPVDSNSFYIAYSDFRTKNKYGIYRKSIMFRKIMVEK